VLVSVVAIDARAIHSPAKWHPRNELRAGLVPFAVGY
jgi:hypothetical protein